MFDTSNFTSFPDGRVKSMMFCDLLHIERVAPAQPLERGQDAFRTHVVRRDAAAVVADSQRGGFARVECAPAPDAEFPAVRAEVFDLAFDGDLAAAEIFHIHREHRAAGQVEEGRTVLRPQVDSGPRYVCSAGIVTRSALPFPETEAFPLTRNLRCVVPGKVKRLLRPAFRSGNEPDAGNFAAAANIHVAFVNQDAEFRDRERQRTVGSAAPEVLPRRGETAR